MQEAARETDARPPPTPESLTQPGFRRHLFRSSRHRPKDRLAREASRKDRRSQASSDTPLFRKVIAMALPPQTSAPSRPLIDLDDIRFQFAGHQVVVPPESQPQDQLYLDVGNALRVGVIDHHHTTQDAGSTCGLVWKHPEFIAGAVNAARRPRSPFTVWLHERPDLDCVATAYLARAYLCRGGFPPGAEALARYV